MTGSSLLNVRGLVKTYSAGPKPLFRASPTFRALDDVSLDLARDETLALVGESGSGKSTLAGIVTRLATADAGSVHFDGRDVLAMKGAELRAARRRIQMVFQNPYGSLNPRLSIGQAITEPAAVHGALKGSTRSQYAAELLERVGLSSSLVNRLPRELSGGQRQRIAIARALSVRPELLIADEAVSALDLPVQAQILNVLEELRTDLGIAILFISHQLPVVSHIADRVAVMYLGRIVEVGPVDDIFSNPAHHYTVGLLSAQPGRHRRRSRASAGGQPAALPSSSAEMSVVELQSRGCAYRDRCPAATKVCATDKPPLVGHGNGHMTACHFPAGASRDSVLLGIPARGGDGGA